MAAPATDYGARTCVKGVRGPASQLPLVFAAAQNYSNKTDACLSLTY